MNILVYLTEHLLQRVFKWKNKIIHVMVFQIMFIYFPVDVSRIEFERSLNPPCPTSCIIKAICMLIQR